MTTTATARTVPTSRARLLALTCHHSLLIPHPLTRLSIPPLLCLVSTAKTEVTYQATFLSPTSTTANATTLYAATGVTSGLQWAAYLVPTNARKQGMNGGAKMRQGGRPMGPR